jgi:hypothetical protein
MSAIHNVTVRLLPGLALLVLACTSASSGGDECADGKCDDPGSTADEECFLTTCKDTCKGVDPKQIDKAPQCQACFNDCREEFALQHCADRRADALSSSQRAFLPDAIRWSCADVEGVNTNNRDDRGQEYCEYFAVIQAPPAKTGGTLPPVSTLGRGTKDPTLSLDLTDDQLAALEDQPNAVVGQCVFSSWHQDVPGPLPVCAEPGDPKCSLTLPEQAPRPTWMPSADLKYPLTEAAIRMLVPVNANEAASDLVMNCMVDLLAGDPKNPEDPLHDDYTRGCMKSYSLFGTEWRRSDPTICAASARLAECGCGVDTTGDGVADITDPKGVALALVPPQPVLDEMNNPTVTLRGFRLGTWTGARELPAGCRHVDTGEDAQTLVACDLTAGDVLVSASDPKNLCREKYGDNVVVHIPVPTKAVVCKPPAGGYTNSCGLMPWVIGAEDGPMSKTP